MTTMTEPRLLVRAGFTISFVGHVAVLAVGLIYAGANPFDAVPAEAIAVDIIPADEVPQRAVDSTAPDMTTAASPSPTESEAASPQVSTQSTTRPASEHDVPQAFAQSPVPSTPSGGTPPIPPSTPPSEDPAIANMFALPLALPDGRLGGGFDAPAIDAAKISADDIKTFREHLRTCLTRPGSISPTDKIRVVLRVALRPDGTLAAAPTLIEASASAKGPALMASAINGLRACQPYAMLPADKYKEWKVLDLSFRPQDFGG